MKTSTYKGLFSFYCLIIPLLFLKLQREYVQAEVRECDDNKFGYECRFQCRCLQNETCDVKTGACPSGCADGYWGSNCQLSSEYYYNGYKERYQGTKRVAGEGKVPCKKWRNHPHDYCRPFMSDSSPWCYVYGGSWKYCRLNNSECPPGLHGIICNKECHCKNASEVCRYYDGLCSSGCGPGWMRSHCDKECAEGTFGEECQRYCHCEEVSRCRKTDGKCLSGGCIAGYAGENCQNECDDGTFGKGCQQECHCADNSKCKKSDGECEDGICAAGYIGDSCQKECDDGTFGKGCQQECHCADNSKCKKSDGECEDGICAAGYMGDSCQKHCNVGNFGESCLGVCHCSNPSLCNRTDGRCADNKCKFGYRGHNCQQLNIAVIVPFLLIPLLIIGIVIGLCVKKRKSKKIIDREESKSGGDICMSHIDELNLIDDDSETEDVYQNTAYLEKDNILSHIEKSKMEEEPFASEFSRLPQGPIYSQDVGSLDENAKKNRYKTVLPYDYSRVVLLPDELSSSDYINASYITKEKKYIATQGPSGETFNDFWRMIWQQKCSKIIMLTDIIENGKLKCAQYWPELNHTETFGAFKIHCVQEKKFMMHTYRLLSITKSTKWAEEESFIDHYQCTTWPDHGVPEDPIYFIEFRNKVRYRRSKPPYVVHCSAGIGRTGTFIALDILLKRMRQHLSLDVFQCVNTLRGQRPSMVYRRSQYQFIYEVLAEDALTGFSEIQTDCLTSEFRRMLSKEMNTKSLLQEHYESLLQPLDKPCKSPYPRKGSIYENVGFNIDEDNNEDEFLETAYLDGFNMINEIILASQPNEKIAEEFWKLIHQQNCTAIIMFEELFNAVAAYWPDEKKCPTDYGSIRVELMCLTETEAFFLRQFKVSSPESTIEDNVFVNHIQSKIWLNTPPPSHTEIIEFIQTVSGYIKPQKRILVHCQDGFTKSGLFSLLYVMLQMLKTDPYVSILRLVRRMKKKNADIDVDLRSYEYCWMVANVFLGDYSVYSNQ